MGFDITYSDEPGKTMYATLFDATDLTLAWNKSSSTFEIFTLSSQSDFALPLTEDSERVGLYIYAVSVDIPAVVGDDFYLIEVRERIGLSYDRANDTLFGTKQFFWNGTREVEPFFIEGLTAQQVWNNDERTLTSVSLTAKDVWEYLQRTLTECPCDNADLITLIQSIQTQLTVLLKQIENANQGIEDLQKGVVIQGATPEVKPQPPRVGQTGSVGPTSSIRIR